MIPHVVKTIKESVFENCSGLTTVTLGDGLEENCGEGILQLHIATGIRELQIHKKASLWCSQLTNVVFRADIEELVTGESMRDWWNHGVHERSLSTY
jgi:hypothetical protein